MIEIQLQARLLNVRKLPMLVWLGFRDRCWSISFAFLNRVENPRLGTLDLSYDATRLLASPCPGTVFHLIVVLPCFQGERTSKLSGSSFQDTKPGEILCQSRLKMSPLSGIFSVTLLGS